MIRRRVVAPLLALTLGLAATLPVAADADAAGDERFLEALAAEGADGAELDRPRLARLVFGAAAQLLGGTATVGLLRGRVVPRDPAQASVVDVAAVRFDEYRAAVETLRGAAAALLDAPGSTTRLHEALVDGQRACWLLDRFTRLAETYGATSADMMGVLASTEACVTLRRVAFASAVRAAVATALADGERAADEAARLRGEVADLEVELDELLSLLRDLAELDDAAGGE